MGFGPEEVEELSALRLSDIQRIERLKAHLDIKVDKEAFADLIRHIRAERRSTEREHEFIRADAPLDMMRRLFGHDQPGVHQVASPVCGVVGRSSQGSQRGAGGEALAGC